MYYIIAYFVVVVINLNKKVALYFKPILLVLLALYTLLNLFCVNVYGCLLSNDFVQIIAGTNLDEAKEFYSTYITWKVLSLFISTIIISILIASILPKLKRIKLGKIWMIASILMLISIGATFHNSNIIKEELINKERWVFSFEEAVDLNNHLTFPKIEECDSIHPHQIVIILGESFSSNHSSLYGYGKITNPLLSKQVERGNLIVYNNVTSPCTHTIATFKYLLNTFTINSQEGKSWYEYTNLIETMKIAGYHTIWLSNQSEKGMFENIPSSHAKICDEMFFIDSKNLKYDGNLISQKLPIKKDKNCIFYHLMGQHGSFKERYPKEYDFFKGKEYNSNLPHQRNILASYDNATLYNDFVVNSIMELYKEQDAVVFYIPDHALDIFDTDPNYFGHAKNTKASLAQGKKIPFMIYVSPLFRKIHSKTYEHMKKTTDRPFCTDKFIYVVMDVSGYRFKDNNEINNTLFQ